MAVPFGQLMTIMIMALALGCDAFSLCLGIGMQGMRAIDMVRISISIALFHIAMPLLGLLTGAYMSVVFGQVTSYAAGGLLLLLGIHMIYSTLKGDSAGLFQTGTWWGTLLFALSVSVDSFSVGVSLGMFHWNLFVTVILFGIFGGIMSILGLKLGHLVGQRIGEYGEAIGGAVLLIFGILFLIPS